MSTDLVSTKYTFACDPDECDCLIELTSSDGFGFPSGVMQITCPCGRKPVLLSVVNATIAPINQTKEEKMEEVSMNNLPLSDAEKYNPDLLVTYKVIRGYSDPEFTTDKVTSIEWDLHNARQALKHNTVLQDKINTAKDIIAEAYPDSQDQDTLRSIAEALGIELTRTVEWTATIEVSGTIELDLLEDYDIEDEITDNLYVDSQSGRIEIADQEVCHVREC
jgi:hypothetical protein